MWENAREELNSSYLFVRVGTQKKFMTAGARAHEAHFKCCCFMVYVIFICCTKEPTYNEEHYVLATCNRVSNDV